MPSTELHRARAPQIPASAREEAFWAAVLARDPAFDGSFFYSVATTGIYCRPSCAARRPKRAHVRFHPSAAEAERAGFRPCKRCKPNQPSLLQEHAAKVRAACRLIEAAEDPPGLGTLAAAAGLSPYHFHRVFKSMLGITPKAYAAAHRRKRLRGELGRSATITEAIYGAGFNSSGRFYAAALGGARHDTGRVPQRCARCGDQIRNRRMLARRNSRRRKREGRLRHSARRRRRVPPRRSRSASSRAPGSSRGTKASAGSWPR